MTTYTVTALCNHSNSKFTLRHNGQDWVEYPGDETTFFDRAEAEEFAKKEAENFEIDHEMKIVEFDLD